MKTIVTVITDDLDESPDAQTHTLMIDGQAYEIDLGDANYAKLREAMDPFIEAARRVRGDGTPVKVRPAPAPVAAKKFVTHVPASNATIRAWWRSNPDGLPRWAANGRIPGAVMEAWRRHAGEPETVTSPLLGGGLADVTLRREAEASVRLDGETQSLDPDGNTVGEYVFMGGQL